MDTAPSQVAPDLAFSLLVRDLTLKYSALWRSMPAGLPSFARRFSPAEQAEQRRELQQLRPPEVPSRKAYQELPKKQRAALRMRARMATIRLLAPPETDGLDSFFDDSERTTDEFVRMADTFDPALRDVDIHQALRNQWVFNSVRLILRAPVKLTPSSFAYSLLYPYTDNILDDPLLDAGEKTGFLRWLTRRLDGLEAPLPSPRAKPVAWLLRFIEEEYPRPAFPMVHESLRAIHHAQEQSLRLHHPDRADSDALTPLTIEKGGTSVIVDGFLAAGRPAPGVTDALFGFGVLLQLIDDLQDLREDAAAGHSTPFVRAADRGPLDPLANRLFHLTRAVTCALQSLDNGLNAAIFPLIDRSCSMQIQSAIALLAEYFSPPYLSAIEETTPLSFDFIRETRTAPYEQPGA